MKTASLFSARPRLWAGGGMLLAVFLGWAATDHAAQNKDADPKPPKKQRVEEEEDTPKKAPPKRKIRIEDEDPNAKPKRPGVNPSGDLAQLAREAKHADVQRLYRKLAVPYDLLNPLDPSKPDRVLPSIRIQPLPQLYGSDRNKLFGTIEATPLDVDNKPLKEIEKFGGDIKSIDPYELLALYEMDHFRKLRLENSFERKLDVYDQLLVEEQVLSAVLRFHASAKLDGRRKGDDWAAVESKVRIRLRDTLLGELGELITATDWNAAFTLAGRIADTFPGETDQTAIAPHVVNLLQKALSDTEAKSGISTIQLRDIHLRLRGLIDQFPNNPQMQALKERLKKQAQDLFAQAQKMSKSSDKKDIERAQELLRRAAEIWPTLEGLQQVSADLRQKLPILRVGVRQLPKYLSPNTAVTDTELRTVEMIFESLVKFTPDGTGLGHYHPGLSEGRPQVIALGREFQLPANALWSNNEPVTIMGDIRATFHALKDGNGPGHSLAWQSLFAEKEVTSGGDGLRVKVNLNKGYIEPLALMNGKIVPAKAFYKGQEETFGLKPVGSGPFMLAEGSHSERGRPYVLFTANLNYGTRPSKLGLPRLREVRFFQYSDALKELKEKQPDLDVLLDVTTEEAAKIRDGSYKVALPGKNEANRRVYFLAVNHRKGAQGLNDANLRAALTAAINREALLDHNFRGPLKRQVHHALNSPYPAHCWACDPKLHNQDDKDSLDPFDKALARAKFAQAAKNLPRGELTLSLKYPDGNPALDAAMKELAAQVAQALPTVKIEPVALDARTLLRDLDTTNYDLAYYHYDFPDDTFWLGPLFAPRSVGDGENIFGYRSGQLDQLLQQAIDHREFAKMREYTRQIHKLLARIETPVIPLWQLDPLHAIHQDLKTPPFDPQRVFTDIEKWSRDRASN